MVSHQILSAAVAVAAAVGSCSGSEWRDCFSVKTPDHAVIVCVPSTHSEADYSSAQIRLPVEVEEVASAAAAVVAAGTVAPGPLAGFEVHRHRSRRRFSEIGFSQRAR